MKTIKVNYWTEIPKYFTGIVEYSNGDKEWWFEGYLHREDGPAVEWSTGAIHHLLDEIFYPKINLKDYLILDSYQGPYNLMWYKLLTEDEIVEYPDIPGLIEK